MRRALLTALISGLLAGCGTDPPPRALQAEPTVNPHFEAQPEDPPTPSGRHLVARVTRPTHLRAAPGGRRLARVTRRTEFGSTQVLAVLERRDGWLKVISAKLSNRRRGWVPESAVELSGTDFELHVDRSARRLELRHRGRVLRRVTIAVGRPGNQTPLGHFAVTDKLRPQEAASPYGCCALALSGHQTRLEPGWPGGDRLAIHGTPATWSIGKAVSLGCMRAHARDLKVLMRRVPLGAPVFIRA